MSRKELKPVGLHVIGFHVLSIVNPDASSQTCDLNMWIVGGAGAAFVMLLVATCLILCFVAYKRSKKYC